MKIIPPYLTFKQALMNGYVERMESPAYTRWVKTLMCVSCNAPADDPHHPHGAGYKGMGTKVPDWWVIPLCRPCHDTLHANVGRWEQENGLQIEYVALTLLQAIRHGVLHFDKP